MSKALMIYGLIMLKQYV